MSDRGDVAEKMAIAEQVLRQAEPAEAAPPAGQVPDQAVRIAALEARLAELDNRLATAAWDRMALEGCVAHQGRELATLHARADHAAHVTLALATVIAKMMVVVRQQGALSPEAEDALWAEIDELRLQLPEAARPEFNAAVQNLRVASAEPAPPPSVARH
jgi:hypothetical protein